MLVQIILVLFSGLVYSTINKDLYLFLYCLYGGLISVMNTLLIRRTSMKQRGLESHNKKVFLGFVVTSVISRLGVVALLVLIGFKINFDPLAILIGLGFGQIGFIIDILRNKAKDGR